MKKYIIGVLVIVIFLVGKVNALSFVEGSYISGEYINKTIGNKTYYLTVQYIKDSSGDIVYCLEPFVFFESSESYNESTIDNYTSLSKSQIRRIELLIYYGYGYNNRTASKWYVITQYLIWKTANSEASIYFTDKLNGSKISKYTDEIASLEKDVKNHEIVPSFANKVYKVNYGDDLKISELNSDYEIVSSPYASLNISNAKEDGEIVFRKKSNFYKDKVKIFVSSKSQDLIKPGNVINPSYKLSVKVLKGDITLDIRKKEEYYTVESDFNNTCYEIYNDKEVINKVCTDKELIYKTDYLPYGDYYVRQVSNGIGYKKDDKIYSVRIDENDEHPVVILENELIKNKIEIIKYYCKDKICKYEQGASFSIYDIKNNLVEELITNENGYASKVLGYGHYLIIQNYGLKDYTFADGYEEFIFNEEDEHKKELYNYYIEEEIPPETKVDKKGVIKSVIKFFINIIRFIKI